MMEGPDQPMRMKTLNHADRARVTDEVVAAARLASTCTSSEISRVRLAGIQAQLGREIGGLDRLVLVTAAGEVLD